MKLLVPLLLLLALAGCKKTKPLGKEGAPQAAVESEVTPVLTPSTEKAGKVAMVNEAARFVVLSFPIGEVPSSGQVLDVYRKDAKIGELRVTGPKRENNTVADIVAGDPRVDDEVRGN